MMTPIVLPPRPWMSTPPCRAVISALERAGGRGCARFVGGCVRDALLDRDGADIDIDIATPLSPDEVFKALRAAGLKAVPTGIEHGTLTAVAPDAAGRGQPFEITTLRRDVETDGRRAVVAFTRDWAEDAARRDFRLNALYLDPDGALHDPTAGGVADALAGRIVFVGDAETRIREDYLRVLRFFRFFAAYGRGEPDAAALDACATLKDGLARLSGERVSRELLKLLAAFDPRAALALMGETGVLAVLLPAVETLGRLDGLVSVGLAEGWAPDPVLRLAALLPDDRSEIVRAAQRLRLSNPLRERLLAACADATPLGFQEPVSGALRETRAAIYRIGAQAFTDQAKLAWADEPAGDPAPWRVRLGLAATWSPPPFPVTGAQILQAGAPEGPLVGQIRRELEAWWIASDFSDDSAAAVRALDDIARATLPSPPRRRT